MAKFFKKRSRKAITYDSNEFKFIIGLIILGVGSLSALSLVIDAPVFTFFRNFFYDAVATLLFALLMFNLSLFVFKYHYAFTKKSSLLGQLILVIFYAAFLNSIWGVTYQLSADNIRHGGYVGYYVYHFFADNLFLNFTPIFIFIMIFISIPLVLAMAIGDFLEKIGSILLWIYNHTIGKLRKKQIEQEEVLESGPAETFGDFQKHSQRKDRPKTGEAKIMVQEPEQQMHSDMNKKQMPSGDDKVSVKDKKLEGAYVNEELQYPNWKLPPTSLLNPFKKRKHSQENIKKNADIIEQTLLSFGIKTKVVDVIIGPAVTQYALDIALGTKVSKIINLTNNLALALATQANSVRLETPIPGTSYIGIEIPNEDRETVYLKEAMEDPKMQNPENYLPLALGKNIQGKLNVSDLQKMPHILVAGATGSGKSILTNGFVVSLLMTKTPDEVKLIMIDPKQVEFSDYNGIPHLITPVITEMDKVINALKWAMAEMDNRYTIFREARVKNIEAYNKMMGFPAIPYIILVVDEMADMMMSTNKVETETAIVRLAQKARATGIHLILATQRPSVDVITGLIKANIPGRIGMSVTTNIDSRVILDQIGAESLLGRGDLLFKDPAKNKPVRIQGIWVSPEEVQRIVSFCKAQVPEVHYTSDVTEFRDEKEMATMKAGSIDDDQFANAVRVIVNSQKGSASLIQRKLSLGYNRSARLLDQMEELGVVGPARGSKPREVLITDVEAFLQQVQGKTPESDPAGE
jgi:DNA segregation ATPase FtsK/SpoIIIE, S-DNA-T family